jgi:hypothetical protein
VDQPRYRQDEIAEIRGPDDVRAAGLDLSALSIRMPFLCYAFSVAGKGYAFCTCDGVKSVGFDQDADGEPLGACDVWVVEKPNRVVLSVGLAYYADEYTNTFSRVRGNVDVFKPGPWLQTVLSVADRVHRDEHKTYEGWCKPREGPSGLVSSQPSDHSRDSLVMNFNSRWDAAARGSSTSQRRKPVRRVKPPISDSTT